MLLFLFIHYLFIGLLITLFFVLFIHLLIVIYLFVYLFTYSLLAHSFARSFIHSFIYFKVNLIDYMLDFTRFILQGKAVATDFEVVRPGSGCGLFNVGVVCFM